MGLRVVPCHEQQNRCGHERCQREEEPRRQRARIQGAIAAAASSLGIASVALWNCRAELASGTLVQVLADWQIEPYEIHAVFAAGRAAKPSARAFADYLATALRE